MRPLEFAFTLAVFSAPLAAQDETITAPETPRRDRFCFGVRLDVARCGGFVVLDLGGRTILTGKIEPPPGDRDHVYPKLASHYYADAGVLLPVGRHTALGVIGEIGGGEGRQGIGVRYVRQLRAPLRLDLTAGPFRVEGHQLGVTRRQWAGGVSGDATVHFAELLAVQARADLIPGGGKMKRASAGYVGLRMEGKSAVKVSALATAAGLIAVYILWITGGPGG